MIHKFILVMSGMMFLVACGTADGADDVPIDSPVTVIEVKAENWEFNKKVYKVFADQPITINFKSEEGKHEFAIKGMKKVRIKGEGSIKKIFEPGEYQIYCHPCERALRNGGHTDCCPKKLSTAKGADYSQPLWGFRIINYCCTSF
ncbi:hypothetical protein ACJROX_09940 [Pseudalkalibacillus sp. A8]|uniref:hypothetical protein n=1 Tax=Pseudalkalibacillus sp. A8 TaxID=3382641 RepID=UPI0038B636A6